MSLHRLLTRLLRSRSLPDSPNPAAKPQPSLFTIHHLPLTQRPPLPTPVLGKAARLEQNGTFRACSPTGPARHSPLPITPLLPLLLLFTPPAQAAPPEAQVSLGISSGESFAVNLDGGLRLLRGDWGVLGLNLGLDIQTDLSALRPRAGLYYRFGLTDALEGELGLGGRLNNLSPFRSGLYVQAALGVQLGEWHLKPWYTYLTREGESRLGLALEYRMALESPRKVGVVLGPDFGVR